MSTDTNAKPDAVDEWAGLFATAVETEEIKKKTRGAVPFTGEIPPFITNAVADLAANPLKRMVIPCSSIDKRNELDAMLRAAALKLGKSLYLKERYDDQDNLTAVAFNVGEKRGKPAAPKPGDAAPAKPADAAPAKPGVAKTGEKK